MKNICLIGWNNNITPSGFWDLFVESYFYNNTNPSGLTGWMKFDRLSKFVVNNNKRSLKGFTKT